MGVRPQRKLGEQRTTTCRDVRSRQRQDLGLRRLWGGRTQPLKPYREEGAARGRESPTSPTPRAPGAGHTAAQEHLLRGHTHVTRLQRSDPRRGLRASSPHYHGGIGDNDAGGQRAVDKGAQDFPPQETNEETCHGEQRGHQRQTRIRGPIEEKRIYATQRIRVRGSAYYKEAYL